MSTPQSPPNQTVCPFVPKTLLDHLETIYPNKMPSKVVCSNPTELMILYGQRQVVEYLANWFKKQNPTTQ